MAKFRTPTDFPALAVWVGKLFMSDSGGLFPAVDVEHVDVGGVVVEVGAGINKRFRVFEPDAVMSWRLAQR